MDYPVHSITHRHRYKDVFFSILIQFCFYFFTAWLCISVLVLAMILPRSLCIKCMGFVSRSVRNILGIIGMRITVRGTENLPSVGCIIAMKHQSAIETVLILDYLRDPAIILKKALLWIPIINIMIIKSQMIAISRKNNLETMKLLPKVLEALKKNRHVLIFPEGTRSAIGATPKYRRGIVRIYKDANAVVVPAAVNTGVFWPRNSFWRYPGRVVIEFLPAITPNLQSEVFYQRLVDDIEVGSARLLLEAADDINAPPIAKSALEKARADLGLSTFVNV